jgi:hypothetical protein
MNGNLPGRTDDDEGIDPELTQLFDEANAETLASITGDAFVTSVLSGMQRARRLRLLRQITGLTAIMVLSAFVAPYVAQQTLVAAGWFTDQLPATGTALLSPIGCVCAALIAWRIARRARN